MNHSDFYIGLEFWLSDRQWRCTDVGTPTVVAIRVAGAEITTGDGQGMTTRTLSREEAEREGWFDGPPYAVAESVFDEDDLEACVPTREEL